MIIRNGTMTVSLHVRDDNVDTSGGASFEYPMMKSDIPCQVVPSSPVAPSFSKTGAPIQKHGCEILVEARHLKEVKPIVRLCPFQVRYRLDGTAMNVVSQCIALEYLRAVNQYKLTCIQDSVY